ncbi:putative transposase [Shigella boydii 3594-74]|uniref:IS1 encoded protein n=1 Tax=Shigella boydii serotype 4 (strain Sb227) TaxID=300268 RepID=Q31V64_SHIBS|nr:putative IS1 encoded protein [Shigella boydii Sb227]EGI94441.1 putative transposase [Shigella boydii 3594-74]EGI94620.1 putative transposase [Shigella boydii 3594-74]
MPCFTAMRAEIALMSGSAFAVTHHAFSSGAGRTSDGNGSHASTLKSPSYTKSVSWQHYQIFLGLYQGEETNLLRVMTPTY